MNKLTKFSIAAASAVALALTPVAAANAVEYNAYSASCTTGEGGTSTFTATKRGFYAWTWRTGSTVNGGGVKYLSAGQSWTPDTPGAANNTTRFGVLTTSKTFAYVTCDFSES